MNPFRELADHELERLSDEFLLSHLLRARAYERTNHSHHALKHLVWRHWPRLLSFVKHRVPNEVADEIAEKALEGALTARFDGSTTEELRALIFRIARRRIADYYRSRKEATLPLGGGSKADDAPPDAESSYETDETQRIARWEVTKHVFQKLSPAHQKVVWLCLILLYDSDSAAKEVNAEFPDLDPPMTQSNVDQIKRRFRKAVAARLHDNEANPDG